VEAKGFAYEVSINPVSSCHVFCPTLSQYLKVVCLYSIIILFIVVRNNRKVLRPFTNLYIK